MKIILSIIILAAGFYGHAQLKQKAADKLFVNMEYAKCVEMYDELAKKCSAGKKNADWNNVRKAAEAHYHLFEMNESANYYEKLHNKNMLTEQDRMRYVQSLRYTEKYGKSHEIARESANLHPTNKFFKRLVDDADKFDNLFADSAFYRLKKASINSDKGDFGVAYMNNSIVYASKAKNTGFINPTYGWDNAYYLNIMQSSFGEDSVLQDPEMLKHNFISKAHDGPVSFNKNCTEMVITKNTLGKKNGKEVIVLSLYFSKLENGIWSELKPFEFNNTGYNVGHGVLSEDNKKLYFVSDKPGGFGEADIYVCERKGLSWGEPKNLGENVNTERDEMFPFVQDATLYFASNGHFGLGGLDVFETTADGSSTPTNVGYPINTSADDFGLIFDQSGRIGYLSSNRGDNIDRIFHVTKRKLNIKLEGVVYEKYATLEPLAEQIVWIKNMTTDKLDSVFTDGNGAFASDLKINNDYRIYTAKEEFILLKELIKTILNYRRVNPIFYMKNMYLQKMIL